MFLIFILEVNIKKLIKISKIGNIFYCFATKLYSMPITVVAVAVVDFVVVQKQFFHFKTRDDTTTT